MFKNVQFSIITFKNDEKHYKRFLISINKEF